MSFSMRTSKPQAGNKYYIRQVSGGWNGAISGKPTDKSCNVLANCVGYANGRFAEIQGNNKCQYQLVCNAENFIERAKILGLKISDKPTLGGIMVWQKGNTLSGNDGVGHVAIVERIDSPNQIYTSESSYGGFYFANVTRKNTNGRWGMGSAYKFRGCIVNPAVTEPINPQPVNENWKIIPQKGTFTSNVNNLRVRRSPSMNGEVVAYYDKGGKVNYDGYVDNEGYRWITYIGKSGNRNYIARRSLDNTKIFGICK